MVEVPRPVSAEIHGKGVVARRDRNVIVEILVVVGLAVVVQIVQARDAVAAENMDEAIDDLEHQWLVQTSGEPPPLDFLQFGIKARHNPNIAIPRGDRSLARSKEVE